MNQLREKMRQVPEQRLPTGQEKWMNESFDMEECSAVHQNKMEGQRTALNSILSELIDEKVSTQRKTHWILGPEDLNDTLQYDFELKEAV